MNEGRREDLKQYNVTSVPRDLEFLYISSLNHLPANVPRLPTSCVKCREKE